MTLAFESTQIKGRAVPKHSMNGWGGVVEEGRGLEGGGEQ